MLFKVQQQHGTCWEPEPSVLPPLTISSGLGRLKSPRLQACQRPANRLPLLEPMAQCHSSETPQTHLIEKATSDCSSLGP